MRKNVKRTLKNLGCAVLCTCLLLINTPVPMSYAGSAEQHATATNAADVKAVEKGETNASVPNVEAAVHVATGTDAVDNDTFATETDALYAASPDIPAGGYKLEINSQADWDNLFTHTAGDGSGWNSSGTVATYIENTNPVTIILNADISLSANSTLTIPPIDSVQKNFLLYGNGHSIEANGNKFIVQAANSIAIDNIHIKNGTLLVSGHSSFNCTNSKFSAASIELQASYITERTYITGCEFSNCPEPCVCSKNAPCPVSFSDCNMDNCGLLFNSQNPSRVSFSGITAKNCTGTVFGQTDYANYPCIIDSISGCELSTSKPNLTAIHHNSNAIAEITDCTITGFDTGIKLETCEALSGDIDTLTIKDTTITDCITGLHTSYLRKYENVIISNLTMRAREGVSGTTGYKAEGSLTPKTFASVNYDFSQLPQIKSCNIAGFDTGISMKNCPALISDCAISDCITGITIEGDPVAIADTTLTSRASLPTSSTNCGVYTNNRCYLIDCDINDFYIGSDFSSGHYTTIIGCRYQNNTTNLKTSFTTDAYNTSFMGGETSVVVRSGMSYFYDCVVEGKPAVTKSGFSLDTSGSALYVYSLERPYNLPSVEYCYDKIKHYSDRTVTNGKSEISNCETGIYSTNSVYIADTHIHDCGIGIKSTSDFFTSYGNNLIENCTDGMILGQITKRKSVGSGTPSFTDVHTDTIRNCSNNGFEANYISSEPVEWNNRLEIYNCGNYGIKVTGSLTSATVDVHDCKTGVYMTDTSRTVVLGSESKVYNSLEWNVYNNSTSGQFIMQGQDCTLTDGELGNIYSTKQAIISVRDLYSDDSVYYLGTENVMFIFSVVKLYGTAVFDTVDSGYILGRRIAQLNADVTSQMFAKKEGYVIALEEDGSYKYAIFAAGCNVTYDVTTNGGDTFNDGSQTRSSDYDEGLTRISYLTGDDIDLSYTASKTGYEFVGWNTDPDATEGLETLTAEQKDITLYAIYKKTAYINYHTYDAASDYRAAVTFYNNQDEIEQNLAVYNAGGDNTFSGYVLAEDAVISSADDVMAEGDNVAVSPDGLEVYCVYEKQGQLNYLKKDGTILSTEKNTVYQICSDNKNFVYTAKAGEPVEGFTFTEWKDAAGNSFVAGSTISTANNLIVLTPVYEVYREPVPEEPTPEKPTPEKPTPEEPTTETPSTETPEPEAPVIQPPATNTPTTKEPSGPKTGDSTTPIAVTILGLLSLLGIVGLSMKDKRKN